MADVDPEVPDDAVLLAAGAWSMTPSARIIAKAVVDDVCVVLLDANGAHGAVPYETVEFYARTHDGLWVDDGDIGPAGDGLGWHNGYVYLLGRGSSADVTVAYEDRIHRVPVSSTGWWIFAARQREFDPHQAPQRIGVARPPQDQRRCPRTPVRRHLPA